MTRLRAAWSRWSLRTRTALVAAATTAAALALVVSAIVAVEVATSGRVLSPEADRDLFDDRARAQLARVDPDRYDVTGLGPPERVEVRVREPDGGPVVAAARVSDLDDELLARPEWRRAVALVAADRARVELVGRPDAVRQSAVLGAAAGVALLLVALATWLAVGRTLRSVDAIREQVETVHGDALHRRVPVPPARDEVARLATTMNRMLDRLDAAALRQRRFVADASHELRSPVTGVRATAEVALAHSGAVDPLVALREVRDEAERLEELLGDLLDLARLSADDPRPRRTADVDLDEIVLAEVAALRRLHPDVRVDTRALGAARVVGHAGDLTRVVRNLLVNAAVHGRGRVAVSLDATEDVARLAVDDDGPGIPVAERERVLEPFVRLDESRARASGGTGLGLALVAAAVRAHGGTLSLGDGVLGGARAVVSLPVRPRDLPGGATRDTVAASPAG